MIKQDTINKEHSFWRKFNNIHLYPTKAEALLKTFLITISWIGGIPPSSNINTVNTEIASAFYLFSLALIMEYIVKLVTEKKFLPKLFPFIIVGFSIVILLLSTSVLLNKPIKHITYDILWFGTFIPQIFIWFDAITMVLIEVPSIDAVPIEDTLKDYGKETSYEKSSMN